MKLIIMSDSFQHSKNAIVFIFLLTNLPNRLLIMMLMCAFRCLLAQAAHIMPCTLVTLFIQKDSSELVKRIVKVNLSKLDAFHKASNVKDYALINQATLCSL